MSKGGTFPLKYLIEVVGADGAAAQFNKTKSAIEGTNQATTPLNKNLQATDKSLTQTGKSAAGTGKAVQQSSGDIRKGSTAVMDLGNSSDSTSKKAEGLAGKFQRNSGLIFGMTMLSSGIIEAVGMFSMYSDAANKVSTAQDELNKIVAGGVTGTESYQKALEKKNAAQQKVNDLVDAGKTNTPQYTKAVRDLKAAEDELNKITEGGVEGTKEYKAASDDLADAQRGLRFVQRNMILSLTDLIPMTLLAVSGFLNLSQQLKEARAAKLAAAGATEGLTKSMKALRVAMIAIPLVAIASALLAIKTNAFGFRDSLDAIGVKLGNLLPGLKPFLQWVRDLATAFGLTEKAMDLSKAWDLLVSGFTSAIEKIKTTDWKAVINTVVSGISNFIKNYNWDAAWKSFVTAIGETAKYVGENMPKVIKAIQKIIDENKDKWWAGFQEALWASGQWIKTQLAQIGKAILNYIKSESPKWWVGFQEALWSSGQWIKTQLAQIGKAIINYMTSNATKWWDNFRNSLGSSVTWVSTQIGKVAQAILNYNWASIGEGIWKKISDAIGSAAGSIGGFFDQLLKGGGQDKNPFTPIAFDPNQQQNGQQKKGMFDAIIKELYMLDLAVKKVQASFSAFSTSIATYANSMKTNLGLFFTTTAQAFTLLDQAIKLHQTSWSTFSTSVSTYASSMTANLGNFFTTIGQAFGLLDQAVKLHQATWSNFSTSVSTYASSMTTNLGNFFKTIVQALNLMDQAVKLHQKTWSTFSTSVATYAKSMTANITAWQKAATTAMTTVASNITKTQGVASKFSTSWSTYMKSMSSAVKSFASAVTSAMNSVVSAANKATSALNKMAAAARKAASAARGAGLMHGGMRISAASGFSGIVNSPTMYGSGLDRIKVGEDFRPELVTVTPLTKGTGNHTGNLQRATAGGGGSSGPLYIENVIILDGREMKRFVQKAASDGFGAQA